MNPAVGLQLYSVKNNLQHDYLGTLEKIAEIGYRNLELITTVTPEGLIFGQNMRAIDLRQHLDGLGLRAIGCHFIPTPELRLETVLADLQTLGVDSFICAASLAKNLDEAFAFNQAFNRYGEVCKKHGVQLYYHNHFQEFQVFGDKSVFEMMIEQMDKDLVMFEFDSYWAVRGGQDPIYWLKKLGKRCDLLHQKDLPGTVDPVNVFEKLGYDSPITFDSFAAIQDVGNFTEIGEGKLNIPGILAAARTYNHARYIIVEQDMSKRPEMESIAVSFANLNQLLAA
jgi:sugar phosphate isomerase/epimerase